MKKKTFKTFAAFALACVMMLASFGCGAKKPDGQKNAGEGNDFYTSLADTLLTNRYALDTSKTDYTSGAPGLRNPYIVGIDGDRFENEVLYGTPAGAHAITVDTPAYEFQDSTPALQAALNEAAAYQKANADAEVVIRFPAGKLYFYQGGYDPSADDTVSDDFVYNDGVNGRYATFLHNRKNITFEGAVDGNGNCTTECLLVGANGVHFAKLEKCENVRFVNLQFDYADLPYYFGTVEEYVNSNTLRIRTWADYPVGDTNIVVYIEYDKDTNCMREAANNLYNASGLTSIVSVNHVENDKHLIDIRFAQNMRSTPIGTKVAMSTMKTAGSLFVMNSCKNVYFETVYLYCGGGSVILGYSNENLYFNRMMSILKPGTDRLLTMAGDVIHVEDTKGDIRLTNSQIENTQDDGINICSHYMWPYNVNTTANSAVLLYRASMSETYECHAGDVLAMMDTVTMKTVGYYGVQSVSTNAMGEYVVTFRKGGKGTLPSGEEVELEADVSKVKGNPDRGSEGKGATCIFSNMTRSPIVLVENTVVRNKRNRGFLIQSRNVTVRNCEFSNVVDTALMLIGEMASFCEATLPTDVVIENCKFINCDDNDIQIAAYNNQGGVGEPGAITRVKIDNNLFAYQQNHYSLYLAGISDIELTDNWFYRPQTGTQKVNFDTTAIMFRSVADCKFDGNRLDKFLPSRDGIFVWEGVDVDSFDWGDNTGFDRKDVFGEMVAQELARLDANIVIDGKIADWAKIAATEILINNVTNEHIQKVDFGSVDPADFSATVKAFVKLSDGDTFAADDGIYFYFDVTDDQVTFVRNTWWTSDCMEFHISSDTESHDELAVIRDNDNTETLQLAVKGDLEGNCQPCIYPGRTTTSICDQLTLDGTFANSEYKGGAIKTAFATSRNGYRGEVFVPFSLYPICGNKLRDGGEIALSFCFIDNAVKNAVDEETKLMTFSNVVHPTSLNNKVPASMTKFKLAA